MDGLIPLQLQYATPVTRLPFRGLAIFGMLLTGIFAGVIVGATTNMVNSAISSAYFQPDTGWHNPPYPEGNIIEDGAIVGFSVGIYFSFIFTIAVTIITGASCRYSTAVHAMAWLVLAVYGLGIIGGIISVILARLDPAWFHSTFPAAPQTVVSEYLRFFWVVGSIWGEILGGFFALIASLILFRSHWRQLQVQNVRQ